MVKKSLSEICLFDTFYPHIHMWGTKNDHFLKKEDDEGDHNDDNDDEDDEEEEDYDEDDGWKLKVAMHWEGRQRQDMTPSSHSNPIIRHTSRVLYLIMSYWRSH